MAGDVTQALLEEADLESAAALALAEPLARELWKYTPVQGFVDAVRAATGGRAELSGCDQPGVRVLPLDSLDAESKALLQQAVARQRLAERYPLTDLAWARAAGGWFVSISGAVAEPLTIRYAEPGVVPLFVHLAAGARATLLERADADGFLAQTTLVAVDDGAELEHVRQALQPGPGHYSSLNVRLGANARYRLNHTVCGGRRRRAEVHVTLDGRGAEAELGGAYLVEGGGHLDQQVVVEHRIGDTVSRQTFHGIGAGKGRSVFNGRIHIHPHAARSDARLNNRNLAVHPEAEMNTKPELEIYTDDVRCAHGATVGQLSADAQFYLVSRGIPAAEARRLLSHGFVRECLWGPWADAAAERFRAALP
ncbi:MAG: SufD family Fe-S cluster assembly protein [Pseudomonadales bacterium]